MKKKVNAINENLKIAEPDNMVKENLTVNVSVLAFLKNLVLLLNGQKVGFD